MLFYSHPWKWPLCLEAHFGRFLKVKTIASLQEMDEVIPGFPIFLKNCLLCWLTTPHPAASLFASWVVTLVVR